MSSKFDYRPHSSFIESIPHTTMKMNFSIDIEGFVTANGPSNIWNITSDYTPMHYLLVMVQLSANTLEGLVAVDCKNDLLVYIPVRHMEIDYHGIIPIIPIQFANKRLIWDDSHEVLVPLLSNMHCECDKHGMCIRCQFIHKRMKNVDSTKLVQVGEFMTYLYTHFVTDYGDLISKLLNE